MKKKLIFLFILIFSLGSLAYFYLNYVFFPVKLKDILEHKASEALHRPVSIGEIHFQLIKGFSLRHVTLWDTDKKEHAFLQIEEANFNILIAPLIKEKAIIIPSLKIIRPHAYLTRESNAIWNFSDLLPAPDKAETKIPFKIYFFKIILRDGSVDYVDKTPSETFSESLNALNAEIQLVLNKNVKFKGDGRILSRNSSFSFEGNYEFTDKKFFSQISLEKIPLAQYLSLFWSNANFSFQDSLLTTPDLTVQFDPKDLQLTGNFLFENTLLAFNAQKNIQGNIQLNNLVLNVDQAKTVFVQADAEIKNALCSLGPAGEISAEIKAFPLAVAWYPPDNKITLQSQMEIKNFSFVQGEHLKIQTDMTAAVKTAEIKLDQFSLKGDIALNNTRADLDSDSHFQGDLSAEDISLNIQNNSLKILGDFVIQGGHFEKGLQLSAVGEITAAQTEFILSNIGQGDQMVSLQSNVQIDPLKLNLGKNQYVHAKVLSRPLTVTYQNNIFHAQSQFQVEEGTAAFNPQIKFIGNPSGEFNLSYFPKNPSGVQYNGSMNVSQASLSGVPLVESVEKIDGKILFKTNQLETQHLTFQTRGMDVRLDGSLNNFTNPIVDIEADIDNIHLEQISTYFPNFLEKAQIKVSGEADGQLHYKGALRTPQEASIEATALLKDATLTNNKWPQPITGISGKINYASNLVRWENLQGIFKNEVYKLTGELADFSRPVLKTTVASPKLNCDGHFNILHSAFQIINLKGDYLKNPFDIKGDVHISETGESDFDVRGTLSLNTQEIPNLIKDWVAQETFTQWQEKINSYKPQGVISLEGLWRGTLKDWRNWQLTFKAQSPKLSVLGFTFDNLNIDYSQREQYIQQCAISSILYDGELSLHSSADLHEEIVPVQANLTLTDLNLAQLREARQLKIKDLAGKLSGTVALQGPISRLDEITGQGTLTIHEGNLYQLKILQGILDLLTIEEIKDVVFTDAEASFVIKNKKVISGDTKMISQPIVLDGKGWIDFDKNLHFDVTPTLSEIAILRSESGNKGATSLVGKIISVEVSGTVDQPVCRPKVSPMRAIKNAAGYIMEGIGGILEEAF